MAQSRKTVRQMELYINTNWTGCYANAYIAEAIAWPENGNHATVSITGITAEEVDAKLQGALRELKLLPNTKHNHKRCTVAKRVGPVSLSASFLTLEHPI